jgi:hypothetical protein
LAIPSIRRYRVRVSPPRAALCVRDYARDVLRLPYAISAILPHSDRSRRIVERGGAQPAGRMEVIGVRRDRYLWPLAGAAAAPPPS